tara:strand:+ start:664 stop:876 length:213 start_codon:yes stop_codon:yes gene_type:complete
MSRDNALEILECRYCSCYFEIFLRNIDDSVNYCPNCGEQISGSYSLEDDEDEDDDEGRDLYNETNRLWSD